MSLNKQIDLFSETAIYDYVAGHMSDECKAAFEKKLDDNNALKEAVDAERQLRSELLAYDQAQSESSPIEFDGFEKLMVDIANENEYRSGQLKAVANGGWRQTMMSLGVIGIVCVSLFFVFKAPQVDQINDYNLLSNASMLEEQDFNQLVEDKRVLQIMFAKDLSSDGMLALLAKYELAPLDKGASVWVLVSSKAVTGSKLEELKSVENVKQVNLISFDE